MLLLPTSYAALDCSLTFASADIAYMTLAYDMRNKINMTDNQAYAECLSCSASLQRIKMLTKPSA